MTSSADLVAGGPWQNLAGPLTEANAMPNEALQVSALSGQLLGSPTAKTLPITLTGRSHPLSGFWSFGLRFAQQDWSRAEQLTLSLSIPISLHRNPLNVTLFDGAGESLLLRSSADSEGRRVFALKANQPLAFEPQQSARFNFSRVNGIGFSFADRVDPSSDVNVELRAADLRVRALAGRTIPVPEPGEYTLLILPNASNGMSYIQIDSTRYPLHAQGDLWLATPPVKIIHDSVNIQGDSIATAILWHSPTNRSWAPDYPATGTARTITLNFPETYNPGWVPSGNGLLAHYKLNGFLNAYVLASDRGNLPIVSFEPNHWLVVGQLLTVLVTILCLVTVVAAAARNARRIQRASAAHEEPLE